MILLFSFQSCMKNERVKTQLNKDFPEKCRELVLKENAIGEKYIFKVTGNSVNEFDVTYLGHINTIEHDNLHILNVSSYFGNQEDSKRGTGLLYIYNDKYENLGYYNLGNVSALPSYIKNNLIVFDYNNEDCDGRTEISLVDSIPSEIFVNCSDKGGDIYVFTKLE